MHAICYPAIGKSQQVSAQSRSVSVSSMIASMQLTKDNLLSLRCDDKFIIIFNDTLTMCTELDVDVPAMPRQRRPAKRFLGTTDSHVWTSSADYFKVQYYNFIDTAVTALDKRYNQDGLQKYVALENLLRETASLDAVRQVLAGYPDIDPDRLAVQISMARQQKWDMSSVNAVADELRNLNPAIRNMFNEVEQLVRLLLTVPCSNAEAERSFSALRRLKIYLRTRTTEPSRRDARPPGLSCHCQSSGDCQGVCWQV
jgi:hAT family C-terminal dimerisation region